MGFEFNLGDQIICDNGQTYTLVASTVSNDLDETKYDFGIANEAGDVVDEVTTYHLSRCLIEDKEVKRMFCVGVDECGELDYVMALHLIKR